MEHLNKEQANALAKEIMKTCPVLKVEVYDENNPDANTCYTPDLRYRISAFGFTVRYLVPGQGSWHTYHCMFKEMVDIHNAALAEGQNHAIKSLAETWQKSIKLPYRRR